jgi:hypothetical protein
MNGYFSWIGFAWWATAGLLCWVAAGLLCWAATGLLRPGEPVSGNPLISFFFSIILFSGFYFIV